jgi:hypothetical protein
MARGIGVALIITAYVMGVNLFFQPVQVRPNHVNGNDIALMSLLIAPFIASRWLAPSHNRATKIAWYLTAFMDDCTRSGLRNRRDRVCPCRRLTESPALLAFVQPIGRAQPAHTQ